MEAIIMRRSSSRVVFLQELNLGQLPRPDKQLLPAGKCERYELLEAALTMWWSGAKPSEVHRVYGVGRQHLHYLQRKFFETHTDGDIRGFRALVQTEGARGYQRRVPTTGQTVVDGYGTAGSFQQCLDRYPSARAAIHAELNRRLEPALLTTAISFKTVHMAFLSALRAEGAAATAYPFCTKKLAYQSVRKYVLQYVRDNASRDARVRLLGQHANDGLEANSGKRSWLEPLLPCDIACYDEQLLPFIGTVSIEHEGHRFVVPLERISLCLLVSQRPRCILAYHLSLRPRVCSADFLDTFSHLLTPWSPMQFAAIPALHYKHGAGFPSAVVPGFLEGFRMGLLRIDNDLTHYADAVLVYLRGLLGLNIEFGQVRRWITRYVVEQVFAQLQVQLRKLGSTTGSGPGDRHVHQPAAAAVKYDVSLSELKELVEVILADINGAPRTELYGASSLEAVAREWAGRSEHGTALPGYLPSISDSLPLPVGVRRVTIRGSEKKGRRPYIEMDHAQYSSDVLRECWHLIGTPLLGLLQRDHRMLKLRTFAGADLGTVNVTGHWSHSFHDQTVRKEIIHLRQERSKDYEAQGDPLQDWAAQKRAKMAEHCLRHPRKVLRGSNKVLDTLQAQPQRPQENRAATSKVPAESGRWTSARVDAERKGKP